MNSLPKKPSRLKRFLVGLALVIVFCVVVAGLGIYNVMTLNRETAALRKIFLAQVDAPLSTQLQFSVGPVLLSTARLIVSHVPDVPPEALIALRCVRSASVGISEYAEPIQWGRDRLLAAHALMNRRGWRQAVSVCDPRSTVVVYVPQDSTRGALRVCLVVLDERNAVFVSGQVDPRDLLVLLAEHPIEAKKWPLGREI